MMGDPKPKSCKACGNDFIPRRPMQKVCPKYECVIKYGLERKRKAFAKKAAKDKREYYDNDKPTWSKKVQKVFNEYVRLRDKDDPCISCQRHHTGQYHAGHFRSVGATGDALRYNEDNCHKQCSVCNNYKSGNLTEYENNLIKKIGVNRVEALKNNNKVRKYTVDELKELHQKYSGLVKELKNGEKAKADS